MAGRRTLSKRRPEMTERCPKRQSITPTTGTSLGSSSLSNHDVVGGSCWTSPRAGMRILRWRNASLPALDPSILDVEASALPMTTSAVTQRQQHEALMMRLAVHHSLGFVLCLGLILFFCWWIFGWLPGQPMPPTTQRIFLEDYLPLERHGDPIVPLS